MFDWFKTLNGYEQILWLISIVFTFLFFIQIASTVLKKTPDKKRKYIFSNFFAFKNISAFFSMFGWVTISALYQNYNYSFSVILGILSGLILMAVMSVLFYFTQKIKENDTPESPHNLNPTGEVIEEIGKKRTRPGKICIVIDGVQKTMTALTDFDHDIKKGTKIRVESVTSNGMFIIKPLQ